jgi:hypothetical protein
MNFLFRIAHVFDVSGRVVVVASDISLFDSIKLSLKIGDELEIRFPQRESIKTQIKGFEMATNPHRPFSFLLSDVTKDLLPIGAEVWSVDDAHSTASPSNGE